MPKVAKYNMQEYRQIKELIGTFHNPEEPFNLGGQLQPVLMLADFGMSLVPYLT